MARKRVRKIRRRRIRRERSTGSITGHHLLTHHHLRDHHLMKKKAGVVLGRKIGIKVGKMSLSLRVRSRGLERRKEGQGRTLESVVIIIDRERILEMVIAISSRGGERIQGREGEIMIEIIELTKIIITILNKILETLITKNQPTPTT